MILLLRPSLSKHLYQLLPYTSLRTIFVRTGSSYWSGTTRTTGSCSNSSTGTHSSNNKCNRASTNFSTAAKIQPSSSSPPPQLCWLDLRGSGLSVLERLLLEECIYQKEERDDDHDANKLLSSSSSSSTARNWIIVGHHDPVPHKFLRERNQIVLHPRRHVVSQWRDPINILDNKSNPISCWDIDRTGPNESVAIVMGIGGKASQLLNMELVQQDNIDTMKRFSGGGTVVLDRDSIWTTIIGRNNTNDNNNSNNTSFKTDHYPKPILQWSSNTIFAPLFEQLASLQHEHQNNNKNNHHRSSATTTSCTHRMQLQPTMVPNNKSCAVENSGQVLSIQRRTASPSNNHHNTTTTTATPQSVTLPQFELREHDYVLGEQKMGGNALSIGKNGFLHHTSFLWDYQDENMEYLQIPSKKPLYRGERNHTDFLIRLKDVYTHLTKNNFYSALHDICRSEFDLEHISTRDAMNIVNRQGGMQAWFENGSRTKVLDDIV